MKRVAHNSGFPREFRVCHSHATPAAHQHMNGGTMTTGEKVDQRLPAGISLTSPRLDSPRLVTNRQEVLIIRELPT
jgi:hypothetical protein